MTAMFARALAGVLALGLMVPAMAAGAEPLTLGKYKTVFQRVLARPGAELLADPRQTGGTAIRPFQPFYVFARQDGAVQVGTSPTSGPQGWIAESATIDWQHNIVASFTPPADRERQLMFDDPQRIMDLAADPDVRGKLRALQPGADGAAPAGSGVVSVEPETYVSISDRFYLLPILGFRRELDPVSFQEMLLLNIASVPLSGRPQQQSASGEFDTGIEFVLDTTLSMQPYVEAAAKAMQTIVSEIRGSDLGARVHFGAVAFRDNPLAKPGIEYRVRDVTPLDRKTPAPEALGRILDTKFATVSTPGFDEDSLAGVGYALDSTDWAPEGKPFGGRYIILLTDAGPKPPGDPDAASRITPDVLQRVAEDRGVAILTLHLQSPGTPEAELRYAAGAYKALSRFGDHSFYYPVDASSPAAVGAEAGRLARSLISAMDEKAGAAVAAPADATDDEKFLGYAMKLRWLGAAGGEQAPSVITAWVDSTALEDARRTVYRPRLLVSRNQLATMAELVEQFIAMGEKIENSEQALQFFDQLQEAVVRLAQNPDRLINHGAENVGDALEFLDGLPYKSVILSLDRDQWVQSPVERRRVLDNLRPRLEQYRRWLQDDRAFVDLSLPAAGGGAPAKVDPGEEVIAIDFDLLP